jgi:hypothetical protein
VGWGATGPRHHPGPGDSESPTRPDSPPEESGGLGVSAATRPGCGCLVSVKTVTDGHTGRGYSVGGGAPMPFGRHLRQRADNRHTLGANGEVDIMMRVLHYHNGDICWF